jgi:putative oxidoreductase
MERTSDGLLLLGRLLLATLFLPSGIGKLLEFQTFAARPNLQALPFGGTAWAAAAVAIEVLVPIALILGFAPRSSALLLIAFVIAATATSHRYWEFAEPARRAQEVNFFKNVGILAGLCFYMVSGPGAWSVSGRSAGTRMQAAE